uniref:probable terpene synthase 11 n=1 Tax=Erigeron canadensis TaxID=72917 RepID=UPI001CB90443|nr:probable terpene synthase 11 [Erigeron canadensis]
MDSSHDIKVGVNKRIEGLKEKTRRVVIITSSLDDDPTTTLKLIDTIQRLGVGSYFEEEIVQILETKLKRGLRADNLCTVALCFRLQRQNGIHINPDVFGKFMDANGMFNKSLCEDVEGLLSLYEASYLGANGEDVLSLAKEFTTTYLRNSVSLLTPNLRKSVLQALEVPRHLRMVKLETRRYIDEYGNEIDHNPVLLELAKLDYNHVQSLLQRELDEVSSWWRGLGLAKKLGFVRDRHVECFLWTVGVLPEQKYSDSRIELAKLVAIMLVIDDIYDIYGSYDDLVLFTKAIQRFDLNELEQLPEYMKTCYMILYNNNNDICDKILQKRGLNVKPFLCKTWIDLAQCYLVEVEYVKRGTMPNLKDYIENGVTTSGAYMAMVHLFFLISEGVTNENMRHILHPYPNFFTVTGTILRLWDDLGTAKEEHERGDTQSSIHLLMKEKNITSEEEGRKQILQLIHGLWSELNAELVTPNLVLLPIFRVALNASRTSQIVYEHDENSYLSSVENHVQYFFYKPIDM